MEFNDPLFHIHLNVDFPFNLTGILYFPKLKNNLEVQKNKINLYSNQKIALNLSFQLCSNYLLKICIRKIQCQFVL